MHTDKFPVDEALPLSIRGNVSLNDLVELGHYTALVTGNAMRFRLGWSFLVAFTLIVFCLVVVLPRPVDATIVVATVLATSILSYLLSGTALNRRIRSNAVKRIELDDENNVEFSVDQQSISCNGPIIGLKLQWKNVTQIETQNSAIYFFAEKIGAIHIADRFLDESISPDKLHRLVLALWEDAVGAEDLVDEEG